MNYSTDRPIETGEQDLLGRASFSEQLGKAIYEYNRLDFPGRDRRVESK